MIESGETLLHWNYFLALENDLEKVSRYIEFVKANFKTYSIELAHLMLAASSEVDVVAKALCQKLDSKAELKDINDYKKVINKQLPELIAEKVLVPRYNLTLHPWSLWGGENNPTWWRSYNKVKHERSDHFDEANLKHVLNAMAGLLVIVFYFYKKKYLDSQGILFEDNKKVTELLLPESKLLKLPESYYHESVWY